MKRSNLSTRIQSIFLALTMVLALVNPALMLNVVAEGASALTSKTEGQIVAENYDLTDGEKALISSEYVIGETVSYSKPSDNDELISVDTEEKTVTVKTYTDGTYTWTPATVKLVAGGEDQETIVLSDGKGNYNYDGKAFSIIATYELRRNVAVETQTALLAAPAALKAGVAQLDAVNAADAELGIVLEAMDTLEKLANEGIMVQAVIYGQPFDVEVKLYESVDNVNELSAQLDNSANGKFTLTNIATDYAVAKANGLGVKYVVENADAIVSELTALYKHVYAIRNDEGENGDGTSMWDNIIKLSGKEEDELTGDLYLVNSLKNAMDRWLTAVEPLVNGDWSIAETEYLDAYLSDDKYKSLATLVAALGETTNVETINETLLVDSVDVQFNMSMSNVTIEVELWTANGVIGSTELKNVASNSMKLTLADGATKVEIADAITASGFEAATIATWGGEYVADKFAASYSEIPETLEGDVTYTVKYAPKMYTVSFGYAEEITVPYGYLLELEMNATAGKAYDYTVNGIYFAEGSVITVDGDTLVDREEGKAYRNTTAAALVNSIYFKEDDKASGIMTSGAFLADEFTENVAISARYPEFGVDELVSIDGSTLTANTYASSYEGLVWMPYSCTVYVGDNTDVKYFENGATTIEVSNLNYDKIHVVYRLELTNIGIDDVNYLANLPVLLEKDAAAQKDALDDLASLKDNLSSINRSYLSFINGEIDNLTDVDDNVKAELKDALSGVLNECFAANNMFKIYNTLEEYTAVYGSNLSYYYKNYQRINDEVDALAKYLTDFLDTDAKKDAIEKLLTKLSTPQMDLTSYASKLDNLGARMQAVSDALTVPNKVIDVNSENLEVLTAALTADGDAKDYSVTSALYLESGYFEILATGKKSIMIKVGIKGDEPTVAYTQTFSIGQVISEADVLQMIDSVDVAMNDLGLSDYYYNTSYNVDDLKILVNREVLEDDTFSPYVYEWSVKDFTVLVEGMEDQIVNINKLAIKLAVSEDPAYRYEYVIGDEIIKKDTHTFTKEQLISLFSDDKCTITRVVVDVKKEEFENLENAVNNKITEAGSNSVILEFVESEEPQESQMNLTLNLEDTKDAMSGMQATLQALMNFGSVKLGAEIGEDGKVNEETAVDLFDKDKISLQAIVHILMNSGFGSDTLIEIMDENGNIVASEPSVVLFSTSALNEADSVIISTTITINGQTLPLDIKLSGVSDAIVQIRNLFADQLRNYVAFECKEGKVNVLLSMPEKAYEAYLAALLATDQLDITDIDAVNAEIAIGFAKDLLAPAFDKDVTVNTISNTLAKLGFKMDLSEYSSLFNKLSGAYDNINFVYDEKSATTTVNLGIKGLIASLGLETFGGMIAEYEDGIDLTFAFELENLGTEYEALYIDIKANGAENKAGLAKDLSAKVKNLAGTSVIVLLDNIADDLVISDTVVLDLNGFAINGKLTSTGNVIVIDTSADKSGTIAAVSGKVTLAGGKYAYDVSAFVKEGYVQKNDGVVANEFYNIIYKDGEITVELDAGLLALDAKPDAKTLIANLAADLIMNGYTANTLTLEGKKVYDITIEDIIGLYTGEDRLGSLVTEVSEMFDSKDLADIINMVVADLTDFEALEDNLKAGKPILTYDIGVGTWVAELVHVAEGDYLTLNVTTGAEKEKEINFKVVGDTADVNALVGIVTVLKETTSAGLVLEGNQYFDPNNKNNFVLDWTATEVFLKVDLSKDAKYPVALAIVLADGLSGDARTNLVEAVKSYYKSNSTAALEAAIEALTTKQVLTALKNFQLNDDFAAILVKLGLNETVKSDVKELEACFDGVAKLAAAVLRKAGITGGDRKIGSFFNSNNEFNFYRENVSRDKTIALTDEYTLTLDVNADMLHVYFKLFEKTGSGPVVPGKLDYSELKALLEKVEKLNEKDYTADSWAALMEACAKAIEMGNNAKEQKDIKAAVELLQAAIDALVEIFVPGPAGSGEVVLSYIELDKYIAIAKTLEKDRYTEASWSVLEDALVAAEAARADATTQAEVNEALNTLKNAITALVKIPVADTEEPVDEPADEPKDDDKKVSPLVWIIPSATVATGAVTAGAIILVKKRRLIDKTPLINYSVEDDIDVL